MKLPQLTFTRFLAALLIVIFHDQGNSFPFNNPNLKYWISFANVFVSYFFILSGFILVISNIKEERFVISKIDFWKNRFARIYPLYFFSMITFLILGLLARTPITKVSFYPVLTSFSLIQSWVPKHANAYNFVAWSLSVECFFYLLFPFVITFFLSQKIRDLLLIASSIWLISLCVFIVLLKTDYSYSFTHYFPLLHLNTFICGVVTGIIYIKYHRQLAENRLIITLIFLFFFTTIVLAIYFRNNFVSKYYHNGLFAPLFISFILLIASSKGRITNFLSSHSCQFLGEISYGIYILQIIIAIIINGVNSRFFNFNHTTYFYLYLAGLVMLSAICYESIEKPSRGYLKKYLNKNNPKPEYRLNK